MNAGNVEKNKHLIIYLVVSLVVYAAFFMYYMQPRNGWENFDALIIFIFGIPLYALFSGIYQAIKIKNFRAFILVFFILNTIFMLLLSIKNPSSANYGIFFGFAIFFTLITYVSSFLTRIIVSVSKDRNKDTDNNNFGYVSENDEDNSE